MSNQAAIVSSPEYHVPRFSSFTVLFIMIFALHCSTSDQAKHFLIIHSFEETLTREWFVDGVEQAADSLGVAIAILNQMSIPNKKNLDSLFKYAAGIGYSMPIQQKNLIDRINNVKKIPIVFFHEYDIKSTPSFAIDTDSYTAGQTAARFILQQFGQSGRFGIITSTLTNKESNEKIRGFRDILFAKSNWKQVNIITCKEGDEQALRQYRYTTRFGNRIIWFVADDCDDFVNQLTHLKKDNFFIAVDLHPKKNSIKLSRDTFFDAVVLKDFQKMGELCVQELQRQQQAPVEMENNILNCGCRLFTSEILATHVQKEKNIHLKGDSSANEILEQDI